MIKSLLTLLCLLATFASFASTTYYVSPNGDDSNSGTIEAPFKTFQKANDVLASGDICYLREGVYREHFNVTKSNVTIRNYANETVLISGCDLIEDWQHKEDDLYYAAHSAPIYQFFQNDNRSNIATYPDVDPDYFGISSWAATQTTVDSDERQIVMFDDDTFDKPSTRKKILAFADDFNTTLNTSLWSNSTGWTQDITNDGFIIKNSTGILLQTTNGTNDHKAEIIFSPEGADHPNVIDDASKEGKSPHVGLIVRASDKDNGYVIRIVGTIPNADSTYTAKILALRLIDGSTANNQISPTYNTGITLKLGTKYRLAVEVIGFTLKVYLSAEDEEAQEIASFTDTKEQFPSGTLAGMYLFNYSTAKFYDYKYYTIEDNASDIKNMWTDAYYLGANSGASSGGSNPFRAARGTIDSCTSNTLYLSESNIVTMGANKSTGGYGKGFILMHPNALSVANEWCYFTDTLYYISNGESPNNGTSEARTRLYAVTMNNISNTSLIGINIKAGAISMQNATNCTIDSCSLRYISPFTSFQGHDWGEVSDASRGVYVSGSDNVIKNSYFGASWSACVTLDGTRNTITNCLLEDANWIGSRLGILSIHGSYCTASYNTIRHSTRDGVESGNGSWIKKIGTYIQLNHNYIYSTNIRHTDGGCFYSNHQKHNLGKLRANTVIKKNWLKVDSEKYGIKHKKYTGALYPDNYSSGYTFHHNLILSSDAAIKSNAFDTASYDNIFINNTLNGVGDAGSGTGYRCFKELSNNLSNKEIDATPEYDYITITKRTNLQYTASDDEFSVGGYWDFGLKESSSAIDAATVIDDITDTDAPDIGCYESGQPLWIAGCTFDTPLFGDQPDYSTQVNTPILSDVTKEDNAIRISWSDNSSSNEACAVERQEDDGEWFRVGTVLAGVETCLDSYTIAGNIVSYRIRNIDGDHFSNISNIISLVINVTTITSPAREVPSEVKLYPNPVKNTLSIEFEDAKPRFITITDIYGRMMTQMNINTSVKHIDTSQLKSGIYLISIDGECAKFIK